MKISLRITLLCALVLHVLPSGATGAVGGGDLVYRPKNTMPVTFSHELHVEGRRIKCSACHNHIFQMEKGSQKLSMEAVNNGVQCGACHNGERAFDARDKGKCHLCHRPAAQASSH